ncbi:MAG: SusC/RagA family TonB-linked outer membrane protein, partial [Sphingobacteriales bacterium]
MRIFISLMLLVIGLGAKAQQDQFHVYSLPDSVPIAGASVIITGRQSVATGNNGQFFLNLPPGSYQIEIKYMGYISQSLRVTLPSKSLQFYLKPDLNLLLEVEINTGYQRLPRERATGSFVTISSKQLNEQMSTDIISRLEAVANSVTVDKRSSSQGNLMVRGLSTISGPRDPLIILDNFPYQGNLENINPNDIESITILKDAAASSIWGTRAGNGVIVLTSKKAKPGQPLSVDFNSNVSMIEKPDLSVMRQLSTKDYLEMEQFLYGKGFYNSKISSSAKPFLSPMVELLVAKNNGSITDDAYAKQLAFLQAGDVRKEYAALNFENAVKQQHALSLRGSESRLDWNLSLGYDQNVSSVAAKFNRLNFTSNNTLRISKKLSLDFGATYTQTSAGQGRANYSDLSTSGFLYPYLRLKDESGAELAIPRTYAMSYLNSLNRNVFADWNYYPLSDYENNTMATKVNDLLLNIGLNYHIVNGLRAKLYYQNERQTTSGKSLYGANSYLVRSTVNAYTQVSGTGEVTRIIPMGEIYDTSGQVLQGSNFRAQLNYEKDWQQHSISLLGGYELNEKHIEGQSNRTYGYSDDRQTIANLNYAIAYPNYITKANSFIANGAGFTSKLNRFIGFYTNFAYTYRDRYTLSASARKDASNLFGLSTNDKWKPLWSVGAAWNIRREPFAHLDWLDALKLRGSYGYSGNVDLSRSSMTTIIGGTTSVYTNSLVARFNQFSNPELRWENVATVNLGLDFSVFKNRISGSIEVYQKKATDLYGNAAVDYT